MSNTIDGAPMIFYGQENGISDTFGFSHYEMNFGKYIPHFKVFNDLGPILGNQSYGLQQLYPVYAAMGQARQFSTALAQLESLLPEPDRRQHSAVDFLRREI